MDRMSFVPRSAFDTHVKSIRWKTSSLLNKIKPGEISRQWIKERGIIDIYVRAKSGNANRNSIYNTFYTTMRNNEFAYIGEFTSTHRRVGVGEFACRRVDRIPMPHLSCAAE